MLLFPFEIYVSPEEKRRRRRRIEGHLRWEEHCLKKPENNHPMNFHTEKDNFEKPWKNDEGFCQLDRLETKALKFLHRGFQCGKAIFGRYVLGTAV